MPSIEIIAIGTELLLGEIQDTNTRYLARAAMEAGIDLYRATLIGDNPQRIAGAIQEALTRADIIITTGGLGPTIDDPTRQAVALAAGTELEFRPELWEQITSRFLRYGRTATENNRRQAFIPEGSVGIENPVGTAPAFYMEFGNRIVISLPGVPREMEYLYTHAVLPLLQEKYQLNQTIVAKVMHVSGLGESMVDDLIGDLETLANPTVGLLAHPGQVDIRVTAKAASKVLAAELIQPIAEDIQQRLGDSIFGSDNETLEGVIIKKLAREQKPLVISLYGMGNSLAEKLNAEANGIQLNLSEEPLEPSSLETASWELSTAFPGAMVLAGNYIPGADCQTLELGFLEGPSWKTETRSYGGSPLLGHLWAENTILDYLRRNL